MVRRQGVESKDEQHNGADEEDVHRLEKHEKTVVGGRYDEGDGSQRVGGRLGCTRKLRGSDGPGQYTRRRRTGFEARRRSSGGGFFTAAGLDREQKDVHWEV